MARTRCRIDELCRRCPMIIQRASQDEEFGRQVPRHNLVNTILGHRRPTPLHCPTNPDLRYAVDGPAGNMAFVGDKVDEGGPPGSLR